MPGPLRINPKMAEVLEKGAYAIHDKGNKVTVEGYLLSISHRYKKTALDFTCKTVQGKRITITYEGFRPFCYFSYEEFADSVVIEDALSVMEGVTKVERTRIRIRHGKREVDAFKVFTDYPSRVRDVRKIGKEIDGIVNFHEADVLYHQRFIYDHQIPLSSKFVAECSKVRTKFGYKLYLRSLDDIEFVKETTEDIPVTVYAWDIEVHNPKVATKPENDKITCIGTTKGRSDQPGVFEERMFSLDDYNFDDELDNERAMLHDFCDDVCHFDPDIMTTYNGNRYDIIFVHERCEVLGVKFEIGVGGKPVYVQENDFGTRIKIEGRFNCDLWVIAQRDLLDLPHKTLKNVADYLGIVKHEERMEIPYGVLARWWDSGGAFRWLYKAYCQDDATATYRIFVESFSSSSFAISRITHVGYDDAISMSYGALDAQFTAFKYTAKNIIIPSKVGRKKGKKIKGATVFRIVAGVYRDMDCYDFKSLYPAIILRDNPSWETFLEDGEECEQFATSACGRFRFRTDEVGMLAEMAQDFLDARAGYKKSWKAALDTDALKGYYFAMQDTYKRLANTLYGMCAAPELRFFFPQIAETITAGAREAIDRVAKLAETKYDRTIVYGDTDSVYFKAFAVEDRQGFLDDVQEMLGLETELDYEVSVFISYGKKKKYAFIKKNGEIVVKGLESRRGDWTSITSGAITRLLDALLKDDDVTKGVKVVHDEVERIQNYNVGFEEITIYKTIKKELDEYDDDIGQVHVAAATYEKMNGGTDAEVGDKFGVVIVKASSVDKFYPTLTTVSIEEKKSKVTARAVWAPRVQLYGSIEDIDTEYYVQNQLVTPCARILKVFGITQAVLRRSEEGCEEYLGLELGPDD